MSSLPHAEETDIPMVHFSCLVVEEIEVHSKDTSSGLVGSARYLRGPLEYSCNPNRIALYHAKITSIAEVNLPAVFPSQPPTIPFNNNKLSSGMKFASCLWHHHILLKFTYKNSGGTTNLNFSTLYTAIGRTTLTGDQEPTPSKRNGQKKWAKEMT
eukprot:scaffold54866_cov60-Attheya_sp.AAC.1